MKDQFEPFIDCRLCGDRTPMRGTKLCDRCWELETRIGLNPELTKTILANLSNQPASEMKLAKKDAIRTAREILALGPVYLDTETTGLGSNAQVVDIAIINYDGTELIKTLVRPTVPIPVEATSVHGITDEDVSTAPTFADISPNLNSYSNQLIVIYNRDYDLRVCHQSAKANKIEPWAPPETICAMELYAEFYGDWNDYHESYRWQKQSDAARQLGIEIPADLHRAAADANLCRLIIEAMAATPLPGEVADIALNLISEQANTIDGLLKWLCAAGLDDDHAREDGGKPDQMIEAERVLRDAMNYLEEYNG